MTAQPSEKKLRILQALATMLEDPKGEKITTAALAARLDVSEAALYRHFASKAQMYEGLIEFIESSIFGLINQITTSEEAGLRQAQAIVSMLLNFAEKNPGMTRVMTGEVLLHENTRLQERMNQFIDRVELSLKQALRIAASQGNGTEAQAVVQANILIAFVLGRWQRYAKTAFAKKPTEPGEAIAILLR
ncbi:nucleoid occlusion factor SlmA [Parvibium lacunae]|uniref:Nucleoid occlusion factor SlmA n=1 Tax=Parvibium lacunae TaxID=1888893 RepID=A0A368L120_9BURK|nr:nucleoid occlusion factor SlmA [Parvibium lacunae]RCS57117.1 nucleoid occlusion factor SlmA [Parvibium lacunae]